eukprot:6175043-Pleurochrysis_carterae.AAC.1
MSAWPSAAPVATPKTEPLLGASEQTSAQDSEPPSNEEIASRSATCSTPIVHPTQNGAIHT